MLEGVKNYNVLVREWNDKIIFLRKIAEGGADKSYGIIKKRREMAGEINELLPELYGQLTGRKPHLRLTYQPSMEGSIESLQEALNQITPQEVRAGHALLGPHRDDFRMEISGGSADEFFSQGEYRISLLALKLALNVLLEQKRGFRPVLILDDLFSELDSHIKENLKRHLSGIDNQIFVTSTETMRGFDTPSTKIMEIREGNIH